MSVMVKQMLTETAAYEDDCILPGCTRDLLEHKQMTAGIELWSNYLNTVNEVSAILLEPDVSKFEENLLHSMGLMAEAVDVDRVYIWKNHTVNGDLYCTQLYEWSEGAEPQQGNELTVGIPYSEMPGWEETLSSGNCISNLVRDMQPKSQAHLSSQGILSILVVPVTYHEQFWGFFGFDDCHREREFSENEEMILRSAGRLIVNAIVRNDMDKEITAFTSILENILNSVSSMIYASDPKTCEVLFINDHMKQHFGIEHDVIGRSCYRVLQKDMNRQCDFCPCRRLDKEPSGIIKWEEHNELTNRTYSNTDRYISWPGRGMVHLQHSIDITDLVAAKELAEQHSRTKSNFLAKMSHEIRTPMNAIVGMTELALRENKPDTKNEYILTVKQAASNLLAIIDDILNFSKIETGKLEIIPRDYSVSSLINDVVSIVRMRVLDSQIRFTVNIDCNVPNTLFGDETRIRQALLNLLSNAVKYTESGFVSLSMYGEFVDDGVINLVMEVMDSGKGIKQEDIEKLFNDFTQLNTGKNDYVEGVGLGLAITRSIVEAMGGSISVKSKYGEGSTFTIVLPQKYHSRDALATVENPESKSALLCERNEIYADTIAFSIKNLGVVNYTIVSTDSGLQEKVRSRSYDFIFVSSSLYNENKDIIMKHRNKAKIVVLTKFGESVTDAISCNNLSTLARPVYSVPIANVLNGVPGNFSYGDSKEFIVRFTAPDAKILIVDDILTNLKVAKGLLVPYNMQVVLCKSGMTAIEAIQAKDYDLVFMDHKMPEMDGIEATQRIRALGVEDSYYKSVPIVAVTANAISGTKEMFLESGFDDFLSKPIDTVKLNEIVEKWIPKNKQSGVVRPAVGAV